MSLILYFEADAYWIAWKRKDGSLKVIDDPKIYNGFTEYLDAFDSLQMLKSKMKGL